jgi:hypothetical protein
MNGLYLGRTVEGEGLNGRYEHPLADLVTHTFVCGASGSGKTVLGKALIEESARRGVPAIVIDLKGDLSSLALGFPELTPSMLAPWVAVEEGGSLGRTALAEANRHRNALLNWGLSEADVRRFSEKVAVEVFTPRSDRGRRLALPLVPAAPVDVERLFQQDPDTALALVSSLAEAIAQRVLPAGQRDREQELLTAIIEHAWRNGLDLSGVEGIHRLVRLIQDPLFERIGALTVEEHLADVRRQRLAQAVNGQLVGADTGWLRGEEMTIDKLIGAHRTDGRTQVSVINLVAISDFEDQSFVVAQVAFAINSWMRQQGAAPGDRPRLIFFLDEIGGGGGKTAFYPAYPYSSPSKPTLSLLVKQGRAFGVACLLATQNPGDIDYKGLANCSTWMIGKLSTRRERDKIREGLADAEFGAADLTSKLAAPRTGQFMVLTCSGSIAFIQERWLLTYHCTLSPERVGRLTAEGLAPFQGPLDTTIAPTAEPTDEEAEAAYCWREFREALGKACRQLERILAIHRDDEKARVLLSLLQDPEGAQRRLLAARASDASTPAQPSSATANRLSDLFSVNRPPLPPPAPAANPPVDLSDSGTAGQLVIDEEGCVTYRGQQYALYRRLAGKRVTVLEDDNELRFLVEGRVLSKVYPRPSA